MSVAARARPMSLDGRSVDAALEQTTDRVTAVQAAILRVFAQLGPLGDDALCEAYAVLHDAPPASPQSIRSRRAELTRRGLIRATNIPGVSAYGRPATVHVLARTATEASPLW